MLERREMVASVRDTSERKWEANQGIFVQDEVTEKAELFLEMK